MRSSARHPQGAYDGTVMKMHSNRRWCAGRFEIACQERLLVTEFSRISCLQENQVIFYRAYQIH
jgi:hypothetical protein